MNVGCILEICDTTISYLFLRTWLTQKIQGRSVANMYKSAALDRLSLIFVPNCRIVVVVCLQLFLEVVSTST